MLKQSKVPLRMCAVTREMKPKNELIRLVKTSDGSIKIDDKKRIDGRGVYISKSLEVLALAKKKKVLNRAFRCEIDDAIYNELEVIINGSGNK